MFPPNLREQRGDLLVIRMVDLDGNALAAAPVDFRSGLADGAGQRMGARSDRAPGDIDRGALLRESQGDPFSHAATGACHDRDLAGQRCVAAVRAHTQPPEPGGMCFARRLVSGRW